MTIQLILITQGLPNPSRIWICVFTRTEKDRLITEREKMSPPSCANKRNEKGFVLIPVDVWYSSGPMALYQLSRILIVLLLVILSLHCILQCKIKKCHGIKCLYAFGNSVETYEK